MKSESHVRARQLLRTAQFESISDSDRHWLDAHLSDCAECTSEARILADAIGSLRAISVNAPPGVVHRTSLAVHERVEQRRRERESLVFLGIAVMTVTLSSILVAPYLWAAFGQLGTALHIPGTAKLCVFLVVWFLPATLLGAAAAWRKVKNQDSHWVSGEDWRQR